MIYLATVHWMSDRWIDLQLEYLRRNMDREYRVYADLEGIDPRHAERFDMATDLGPLPHAQKLNALADLIAEQADPGDVLIFLDGDAFPVAPLGDFLEDYYASRKGEIAAGTLELHEQTGRYLIGQRVYVIEPRR